MREPTRYSMIRLGRDRQKLGHQTNGNTNLSTRYFVTPIMKDLTNYRPNLPTPAELALVTNRLLSLSKKLNVNSMIFSLNRTNGYTNFLIEWGND
jgi:hypothetical protein